MKQYQELLDHIMKTGVDSDDRTGVGTRSIFGYQMRFDLNDGFPIVTSRFISSNVFITEMIWMLTQKTSTDWLHDNNLSFWDDWADHNNNLGPIYNHQFTNFGGVYDNIPHSLPQPIRHFPSLHPISDLPSELNHTLTSNGYGDYIVIEDTIVDRYMIQFCATGYSYVARVDKILDGAVYDPYYPSQSNAGYLGDYYLHPTKYACEYLDVAYARWRAMLARCYNPTKSSYTYYGGRGAFVCDRWHNFINYLVDLPHILGWIESDYSQLELDKDILGNGFEYSPLTCKFVSHADNMAARFTKKYVIQHTKTNAIASFTNSTEFRKNNNINNQGNFDAMLRGSRSICEDWALVECIDMSAGVNQIQDVIDSIKTNPSSRRHVLTLWNPVDLQYQQLACCHGTVIQFYVSGNKLSCHMYQRSCDAVIGLPHNIGEYALLTHMIAAQCDLDVGEFVWSGGDVHIYSNHLDQIDDLLSRDPKSLPTLMLNDDVTSIFEYGVDDITIDGYNHHPSMKFSIAV